MGRVDASHKIEVKEVEIDCGDWKEVPGSRAAIVDATEENIDDLFDRCERMLGEGLNWEFWKLHTTKDVPARAKLELYAILQDKDAFTRVDQLCETRLLEVQRQHAEAIERLPSSRQEAYRRIKRIAKMPSSESLQLPEEIQFSRDTRKWDKHLYIDERGAFHWNARSGWETLVLTDELARKDLVGWLRVVQRKDWALAIPYEQGGTWKTMYPDMLVVRKVAGQLLVEIIDPHNTKLGDSFAKAVGLAKYAEKHGDLFGRIELVRVDEPDIIRRIPLHDPKVRKRVKGLASGDQLEALFDEQ